MQALDKALAQVGSVLLGKPEQLKLALACMLAGGHLLIEDLPGMGKTTLAHALARVFRLDYRRVQFTSDMLPADILGVSVFDPESQQFSLREGPVFSQLLLADEINRATPKTQGALLEAMEERQVTLDGVSRPLPSPFFVVSVVVDVLSASQRLSPKSDTFARASLVRRQLWHFKSRCCTPQEYRYCMPRATSDAQRHFNSASTSIFLSSAWRMEPPGINSMTRPRNEESVVTTPSTATVRGERRRIMIESSCANWETICWRLAAVSDASDIFLRATASPMYSP